MLSANSIFNQITKGRGFNMKEELGYIDEHFLNGQIKILNPMKDFLTNEILIYNHIYSLPLFPISSGFHNVLFTLNKGGIQGTNFIISSFFNALQSKMNSTINTVVGTAERLKKEPIDEKNVSSVCNFCLGFRDSVYNKMEIGSIDELEKE